VVSPPVPLSPPPASIGPRPDLAVAFVYLHAQAGPDYFADVPFAWTAGELRALGIGADVIHVHFERDRPALQARLQAELIATLQRGGFGLVVFEHCWMPDLLARVRSETGALLCETEPFAVHPDVRVDFVLHHFTEHRQPLIDLALALRDGTDTPRLRGLRNLRVHLDGAEPFRVALFEAHPAEPDARRPFCPVVERITIGEPVDERGLPPPVRKTLDTNKGCPFSASVRENPEYSGLSLDDPAITMAGCAFCPMGGDYKTLPWRDSVAIHLDHIAYYQRRLPDLAEIVLRDQHALRYVPALLQGAIDRGLRPFGLLVPGRGDAILRFGEQMRQAAAAASGTGFWFTIYLVGFESFSQPQLDLYNKAVTTAQYADAIAAMRALHREHRDAFRLDRTGGSSFILWNPWTTLDDLRANVDFCEQHAVGELARGLTTTRLRLYPHLPLFHKALAEGLLTGDDPAIDRGAAHTGYAAEAAWRYRDPRVGVLEELHERLRRHCHLTELVGLLGACERHVRRVLAEDVNAAVDTDGIEAAWIGLRGLWRQEHTAATELSADARRERAGRVDARALRTVLAGRACNNGCVHCVAGRTEHDDEPSRLAAAVSAAAATGRVTIAGREPTLVASLLGLVRRARESGAGRVELVSNGRVLANPGVCARLQRAGLTDLLLKRHRLTDGDEDAYARADGAGAQLRAGVAHLAEEAAGVRWRLLLIVTTAAVEAGELGDLVRFAIDGRATGVQLRVPAAEMDLGGLPAVHRAVSAAMAVAGRAGISASIEGF